jgi:anti-sigma B factor antagonist
MLDPKPTIRTDDSTPGQPDVFVVSLEGEFDVSERVRLLDAFAVTTASPSVVIDFEKARYIDSSVLECLIALERTIEERGARLCLTGLGPELRRILEICALEPLFDIRAKLSDVIGTTDLDSPGVRRLLLTAQTVDGPVEPHPYR